MTATKHECRQHNPGALGCYTRHGCRCKPCRTVHARSCKRATVGLSRMIPDVGAKRRLQALCALGWTLKDLGEELGINPRNLQRVRTGRAGGHIQQATAQRIAALYDRLSMKPPPDSRYARERRTKARGYGWVPPLAWDEGAGPHGIDNPDATPVVATGRRDVIGEIRHLASQGAGIQELMAQLGVTRSAIDKACRRAGDPELWQKITREAA